LKIDEYWAPEDLQEINYCARLLSAR